MTRRKTGPDRATADMVLRRDRHRCRRCGGAGQQIHHRRPRGMGGTRDPLINSPSNLVLLCQACHAWIEGHRTDAARDGWLLSRLTSSSPASVPIVTGGLPVWLGDDGDTSPTSSKEN